MQVQIFTLPLTADSRQTEELNHFLRANKIIDIRKELAVVNGNSVWSFCVTYMADGNAPQNASGKAGKVDYKEVLDEDTFNVFSLLRKARKAISESESLPAYTIFMDAELAEIAKMEKPTAETVRANKAISNKHAEKYAAMLLSKAEEIKAAEAEPKHETNGIFD